MTTRSLGRCFGLLFVSLAVLSPSDASAYINQTDGTVVPVSTRLQQCLDRAGTGETMPGAVDAIADAAVLPEAYRPVLDAVSGHYRVTFLDIGEGAGFRNSFGWFWIGTDTTDPANLHTIFGCRTYGTCACPCATTRTVSVDFDLQAGFAVGRPIGFWLRTPERLDATRESGTYDTSRPYCADSQVGCDPTTADLNDSCGGRLDSANRIYFTSAALNDDGDFVHFLVYRSATRADTFYFGFEDLFRGGDNDYEDMMIRGTGLVPECDPTPETCNGRDDDCDLAIDESLTMACSTMCGAGVRRCVAGSFGACDARVPTAEACNATDDDCDGSTDEGLTRACMNSCGTGTEACMGGTFAGCTAPTPTIETCNSRDDDCDGSTDEGLTRACGSDCGSGVETCTMGSFGGCTAPMPGVEVCDGDDDDCDGRVDEGLIRDCSNMCGSGFEVCRAGMFGECTAPDEAPEACNGLDDDCDGTVDEGLTRACSTECGVGTERCVMGSFVGCDAPTPGAEVCNNLDDDCDGVIDDGNPGGGASCVPLPDGGIGELADGGMGGGADGGIICANGRVQCVEGALVCRGSTTGSREVCNCLDDDCDGAVDEDADGDLCPGGACIATECTCRDACAGEEFPCPPGRICDRSLADPDRGIIGYCIEGRCAGVMCSEEELCNPETGACENLCTGVVCRDGFSCVRGACIEDNCYGRGCPTGEICRMDASGTPSCMADACATMACGEGEFCRDGACVAACLEGCAPGETCDDGSCVPAPCGGACGASSSCIEGECVLDSCAMSCGRGRVCRGDRCVDDPCGGIRCPAGTECDEGECAPEGASLPPSYGLAAGGGGCLCAAPGGGGSSGGGSLGLALLLGLVLVARRRGVPRVRAMQAGAAVVLAVGLSACDVDPYCFDGCEDAGGGGGVDAGRDGGDGAIVLPDGCVPTGGDEECNERDDDCDGLIDETFDTTSDPRNCGGCGMVCNLPFAFPSCTASECTIERCEIGHHDANDTPGDGCEYACPPSGDELCDGLDNDCDVTIDEGFDLTSSLGNCGRCGNLCAFANAGARCEASACVMEACRAGFVDLDMDTSNGCEYRCTAAGVEACNGVDDDCDRRIDEGFDLAGDPTTCGACGRVCAFPNVSPRCVMGECTYDPLTDCVAGFLDVDGDRRNGCEYACVPTGRADTCDRVDDDCDGRVDEAEPMVGASCGTGTGACETGTLACVRGALDCAGDLGPQRESCNGADDDCDGRTDESTAGEPIPSVGDRCGATDVGICAYGAVACTGGALVCAGEVRAGTETCNGLDDDCDGAIDDSPSAPTSTPPTCSLTAGVCAGRTPTCRGAMGWICDFPATYQMTETRCEAPVGLDNDCDGTVNEGCLTVSGASDTRLDTMDTASAWNSFQPYLTGDGADRVHVTWTDLSDSAGTAACCTASGCSPVTACASPRVCSSTTTTPGTCIQRAQTFTARSTTGGTSFLAPAKVDGSRGAGFAPQLVVVPSTTAQVVWAWPDFRGGTSYREIWTRRSTDSGASFLAEVRANASGGSATTDSYNVDLAAAGANVYAVYEAFTGTRSRHIFFTRSTDGGATWVAPVQASSGTGTSFVAATPRVAAVGTNVYVVWRDNRSGSLDVYLRRSTNSGSSFAAAEVRIDTGTTAGSSSSFSPELAAEGANVYVAWVDDRDAGSFDIWLNRSTDSGATWLASAVQLDQDAFHHDSIEPHVVAPSGGVVMVAWLDYRAGFPDPYVVRSTTAGASFGAPVRIDTGTTAGASGSFDLAFAARGSVVGAAWADERSGLLDIYANFSIDGGATWQPQDYRLDSSALGTSDSQTPAIYASSSALHVVWVDHRQGAGCPAGLGDGVSCANGDIYYRRMR